MPSGTSFISTLGARSLYVYLLHIGVVEALQALGIEKLCSSIWQQVVLLVLSIGVSCCLSSGLVWQLFKPVVEPSWHVGIAQAVSKASTIGGGSMSSQTEKQALVRSRGS